HWEARGVQAPIAREGHRRAVVLQRVGRVLRADPKTIEPRVLGKGFFGVFLQHALNHLRPRHGVLQSFEWFDFADHPETRTIVEESDPRRFFNQLDVILEPWRRRDIALAVVILVHLDYRSRAIFAADRG